MRAVSPGSLWPRLGRGCRFAWVAGFAQGFVGHVGFTQVPAFSKFPLSSQQQAVVKRFLDSILGKTAKLRALVKDLRTNYTDSAGCGSYLGIAKGTS